MPRALCRSIRRFACGKKYTKDFCKFRTLTARYPAAFEPVLAKALDKSLWRDYRESKSQKITGKAIIIPKSNKI